MLNPIRIKPFIFLLVLLSNTGVVAAEEPDHAIHEALRALLQGVENAVNEERYNDLAPYFHQNLRVTTINQEIISLREEIPQYFNRWFGPGGYLKKVNMKLNADATTELYGDNSFGIVRGSGDEDYVLSDKRYYAMKTRWTATVIKDTDGQWRILSLHIGTNFLDNPILTEAENALVYFTGGGVVAGIFLILLINWLRRRFKTA